MNVKKKLENRIRGWFPQEPEVKFPPKIGNELKRPIPRIQNKRNGIRGTPIVYQFRAILALLILFACVMIFLNMFIFFTASFYAGLALALGVVSGVLTNYFIVKRQLRIIERNGEYRPTIATLLGIIGVTIVLIAVFMLIWESNFGDYFLYTASPLEIRQATALLLIFINFYLPTSIGTEVYIIQKWQLRNQREILRDSSFLGRIYPSPPISQSLPPINLQISKNRPEQG